MPAKTMELMVPADPEFALAVGLAIDGLGMKAGLDLDLLADLRTLCAECMDTFSHQFSPPEQVHIRASLCDKQLCLAFTAVDGGNKPLPDGIHDPVEITQGILETLMPDVSIDAQGGRIRSIRCSMPV